MHNVLKILAVALFIFCPVAVVALPAARTEVPTLSLVDCYKLAIEQSEQLKIKQSDIEVAEARYRQAMALVYPELSLHLEQRIRDNSNFGTLGSSSTVVVDDPTSSSRRGRSLGKTQFDGYLTVEQPLFNGFRDFFLADAATKNIEASKLARERAREILYADVAELYFQIYAYRESLGVIGRTQETLNQRVNELREFIKLGKSRESEVLAANSDLADNEALRARTRGLLDASLELLSFLTGLPSPQLNLSAVSSVGGNKPTLVLNSIDTYITRAKARLDLQAADALLNSQSLQVKATERQRWPDVSLKGSVYPLEDPDRNRDWDMMLQMTVPLFEGGRIAAETAEARARVRASQFSRDELARQTERDIRLYYSNVQSQLAEQAALGKLKAAAEKEYHSTREDYQLGVVTNLEVLSAIQQVHNAQRRIIEAEANLRVQAAKLEVAAGGVVIP